MFIQRKRPEKRSLGSFKPNLKFFLIQIFCSMSMKNKAIEKQFIFKDFHNHHKNEGDLTLKGITQW